MGRRRFFFSLFLVIVFIIFLSACSQDDYYNNLTKKNNDYQEADETEILRIKTFDERGLYYIVKSFNLIYPNIEVIIESTRAYSENGYSDEQEVSFSKSTLTDLEEYKSTIAANIISDEGLYDLVDITPLNYLNYAESGYIESLDTFIENDETFNLEDYFEPIVKGYTYEDKIYGIPANFTFDYGRINTSFLELSKKYTLEDFNTINYSNSINLYFDLKENNKIDDNITLFPNNEADVFDFYEIFSTLDLKKKQADFLSNDFEQFIVTTKKMDYFFHPNIIKKVTSKTSWDPDRLETFEEGYKNNEDFSLSYVDAYLEENYLINILSAGSLPSDTPTTENEASLFLSNSMSGPISVRSLDNKIFAKTYNTFVIPKNADNKDAAWKFIKFLISDEKDNYTIKSEDPYTLPVNKNNFEFFYKQSNHQDLRAYKNFLQDNINDLTINHYDNTIYLKIQKNMYDYLFYETLSIDDIKEESQKNAEIYLSE